MNTPPPGPAPAPTNPNRKFIMLAVAGVMSIGCCLLTGIGAAVGIPAFVNYVKRSKTTEASAMVRQLAELSESHYLATGSLPSRAGPLPAVPSQDKFMVDWAADPVFRAIGFDAGGPVYYSYSIEPTGPGTIAIRARGDLDGDGVQSLFELTIGQCTADAGCQRSQGIYVERELE
ncbi:MAG: hypothetical protein AAF411_05640 [Myxococcota bacterium]